MDYALILTDYPSGFLSSFLSKGLKTNQLEVNTDEKTLRPIARLKEPRDLFALPRDKENDCPQQAPRWPIECQVIEERIVHIPYVPPQPEPYYQPTGNELKPHPVGEDAGVVVFNYNPISAVNYDIKEVKLTTESSDSDISSSESRASTPKESMHNMELKAQENPFTKMLEVKNPFSKLLETLHQRSPSCSHDDEDDDEDDEDDDEDDEEDDTEGKCDRTQEDRQKGGSDEIEDIWANKSPEYQPATPTFIKSQFGKNVPKIYTQQNDCTNFIAPVSFDRDITNRMTRLINKPRENVNVQIQENNVVQENTENVDVDVDIVKNLSLPCEQESYCFEETKSFQLQKIKEEQVIERNNWPKTLQDQIAFLTARLNGGLGENSEIFKTIAKFNENNSHQLKKAAKEKANLLSLLPQFSRSAIGGSKILTNCHPSNYDEAGEHLEFESRFECGNLAKAVKITESYYELYLRPDLYTSRSKQWFYFRVRRTKKSMVYRFSIVNLVKSDSLYNEGMRPLMYSTTAAEKSREGWRRCGDNIRYYRNDEESNSNDEDDENASYTLTFNIEFPYDDDTVYFAHSYPYTYTDLQEYLMEIQKHPVKSKYCKLRLLCRSLAGNNVYYLTVTAPTQDEEAMRRKKAVVVSARVHPSEVPASWMMKGLMDFITGDSQVAKRLRHKFIFKLIPMLNPDGVIVGNTRNSLTGKDLNRQYRTVIRETYPSIWYTKAMIKRLIDECGIAMYCDMHAHSRKHNIFIYGCENRRTPEKKLTEQVFPLMMHKNVADKFSFESCKFKIQRSKEGTGRIVMWMLGITNSYTIEASFGGTSLGSRKGTHFNTADYEQMGRAFCETLLDYCDENPNKERLRLKIIERLLKEGSSADEPLNIPLSDYSSDEGETSSSSDNEGKDSFNVSDLEGPCCAPLKAPPTSPETAAVRRFKLRRMRKVMSELDRIYFQPLLKNKFSNIVRKKKKKPSKKQKIKDNYNPSSSESNDESDGGISEVVGCSLQTNQSKIKQANNVSKLKIQNKNIKKKKKVMNKKKPRQLGGTNTNRSQTSVSLKSSTQATTSTKSDISSSPPIVPLGVQVTVKYAPKNTIKYQRKAPQVLEASEDKETSIKTNKNKIKLSRKFRLWLEKRQIIILREKRKCRPRRCLPLRKKRDPADRTPLDMPTTDPGSDIIFSTDDEMYFESHVHETTYGTVPRTRRTLLLQSELQRRYIEEIGDAAILPQKIMPPELIVTSPTKSNSEPTKRETVLLEPPMTAPGKYGISEFPMPSELCARTGSWQNLHTTKFPSKLRFQNNLNTEQRITTDDLQLKLSLKKKIWSVVQPEFTATTLEKCRTINRSLSPMPLKKETRKEQKKETYRTEKRDDNELLLTACSQKLLAWQLSGSNLQPIENPNKKQITVNLLMPNVKDTQNYRILSSMNAAKTAPKPLSKIETSSSELHKLKLKKNSLSKIAETTQLITRLAKSKSRPFMLTAKKMSKTSNNNNSSSTHTVTNASKTVFSANKFKTGGIVATAVQSKHVHRKKKHGIPGTTLQINNTSGEKSNQRTHDSNNDSSMNITSKSEQFQSGIVRKVKFKLKKKKRSSSANAK